jgi:A/G-specific adenine glycosylase
LIAGVAALTGVAVRPLRQLTTLKHGVTRFRITLDCHLAEYVSRRRANGSATEVVWVNPSDLETYPLSVTGRTLARLVVEVV